MADIVPWSQLLPVAQEAIKHRKEIQRVWNVVTDWLLGEKRSIAFTGLPGIGKTVLLDFLKGDGFKQGYSPPPPTERATPGKILTPGKRLLVMDVPGDRKSGPRVEAINDLFATKGKTPDGVVHVVAYGFAATRHPLARESLVRDKKITTIQKYRKLLRDTEREDLEATCAMIRNSVKRFRKPTWLLIAVDKIDLYQEEIDEAQRYYSPHGAGKFVDLMKEFQSQVGSDNLKWDAVPVCTWLEDFHWNAETQKSTLKGEERDAYLTAFAKHLERYCA